jgi:uncharacterized protein
MRGSHGGGTVTVLDCRTNPCTEIVFKVGVFIKLLLIVFLIVIVFFVGIGALARAFFGIFSGSRKKTSPGGQPSSRNRFGNGEKAERMLACTTCGVHVPESEGVKAAGKFFCCKAHCK